MATIQVKVGSTDYDPYTGREILSSLKFMGTDWSIERGDLTVFNGDDKIATFQSGEWKQVYKELPS